VRVTSAAICDSDLHLYNGFVPSMLAGDILGHEFMGEVVEVGPQVKNLAVGDRVGVPFAISCGNSSSAAAKCSRGEDVGSQPGAILQCSENALRCPPAHVLSSEERRLLGAGLTWSVFPMKALLYNGPRNVKVAEVPDPKIEKPTDVIVRITATNICGSDLHMYEGRTDVEEGKVLGHVVGERSFRGDDQVRGFRLLDFLGGRFLGGSAIAQKS